jgi:hypothetical protein
MKEISEISWQVTEPEYRQHPALSQSTLGKYERNGRFDSIPTLFDKESSPSLTFGSLVDGLLTGTPEELNKRFLVAEFPKLEAKELAAVTAMYEGYHDKYATVFEFSEEDLKTVLDGCDFYRKWGDDKRFAKILSEDCALYYKLLKEKENKELINQELYNEAEATVQALRGSQASFHYFRADKGNIKRYYQLKFKDVIDDVEYRGMLDLIIVDYENKVVIPCDLKTSSYSEYSFFKSFIKWRYDIQARLYWRLLRMAMDKDDYFKDFKLLDFRFIVVNKENRNPLVWDFADTQKDGDLSYPACSYPLRAPWTIGKELRHYLDDTPKVPDGITRVGVNHLCDYLNQRP